MHDPTSLGLLSAERATPSVMIVDDDDELRGTLTQVLCRAGYHVQIARNGREALELLDQVSAPDLILLDLVMPQMDGWEFRLAQRRRPDLAEVPVIVLSADHSSKARAIDADGYLHKPLDAQRLLHAVELRLLAAERRKLDRRAAELDRYGSMGVLAAGIAHEINNPLAVVTGNVDLAIQLLTQLSEWDAPPSAHALARAVSLLRDARLGAGRVATVVRAVATFSHPPDTRTSVVNLAQVLESSIRLVENEVRHRAKLVCEFDDQLRVVGNTAQLGQVFINLLTNAAHAIEEGNPAGNGIRVAGWRTAAGRTIVEVSDTGRGIPPGQIARVFDPFFTTTDAERAGLGLGLAVSQRLVAAANGTISVRSVQGTGASFRVDLPSYNPPVVHAPAAAPSGPMPQIPKRLRVMVIDDEPLLLEMLSGLLADACDVTAFSAPREALAALRADRGWDVVLSDIMMPELSGMDLYAEVVHDLPELTHRFVFMTGGTFTARTQAFVQSLPYEPLLKPFSREAVLTRVRQTAMMAAAYDLEARTANPPHQGSEGSAPGPAKGRVK